MLDTVRGEAPLPQGPSSPLLVVGLTGEVTARSDHDSATLGPGDVLTTDQPVTVDGAGLVAIVHITSA